MHTSEAFFPGRSEAVSPVIARSTVNLAVAVLPLVIALGVVLIALADTGARMQQSWPDTLFWVGIVAITAPAALLLLSEAPTRAERVTILVLVGLGLFAVKVLQSPTGFTFTDELAHWRTLLDIDQTQHLFVANSLLPVSPLYPALEILTHAFMSISGLPSFESGIITLGIARVLFVVALYLLFLSVVSSERIVSLAVLLFMGNSNFVFFNVQFSYASLALPLAAVCLVLIIRRASYSGSNPRGLLLFILLCCGALVFTHHITTYMLLLFLAIWVFFVYLARTIRFVFYRKTASEPAADRIKNPLRAFAVRASSPNTILPTAIILIIMVVSLTWTITEASPTIRYLAVPLSNGIRDFLSLLTGTGTARQLFQDFTGLVAPLWERISTFVAIGLIGLGLLLGLWPIWRQRRFQPLILTLAFIGAAFPVVQMLRLNASAWEISNRLSEFIFLAVAFIIAVGIVNWSQKHAAVGWRLLFMLVIVIIIIGGLNSGWPFWARLPGPYLVAADTRSVESRGINAALWVKANLGAHRLMGADRINRLLLATYGDQDVITNVSGEGNVAFVYMSPNFENSEKAFLRQTGIEYLLVDERLSTSLPVIGVYFEKGEPDTNNHTIPLSLSVLTKFDKDNQTSRIYDDGAILIYDVQHASPSQ